MREMRMSPSLPYPVDPPATLLHDDVVDESATRGVKLPPTPHLAMPPACW
ncbi:hypothetical protein ACLK1T_16055 [Escherichia coli]